MKWEVCKAYGKPPSHPDLLIMNEAQWVWTFRNIIKDREEEFKRKQEVMDDFYEYLFCLLHPKEYNEYKKSKAGGITSSVDIDKADSLKSIQEMFNNLEFIGKSKADVFVPSVKQNPNIGANRTTPRNPAANARKKSSALSTKKIHKKANP